VAQGRARSQSRGLQVGAFGAHARRALGHAGDGREQHWSRHGLGRAYDLPGAAAWAGRSNGVLHRRSAHLRRSLGYPGRAYWPNEFVSEPGGIGQLQVSVVGPFTDGRCRRGPGSGRGRLGTAWRVCKWSRADQLVGRIGLWAAGDVDWGKHTDALLRCNR